MASTTERGLKRVGISHAPERVSRETLTSGRLLVRNSVWNGLGYVLPLFAAIPATPVLIRALGTERFGILALAWAVLGYLTFFDFGLGRALTQLLARKIALKEDRDLASVTWTGLGLIAALSFVLATAALALTPTFVETLLKVPQYIRGETVGAFSLLALSIPIVVTAIGLRSVLEANQRFMLINAVRLPMGVFIFVGPVIVLPFSHDLRVIILTLILGRVAAWIAQLILSFHVMPSLAYVLRLSPSAVIPLIRFGSWTTVTNLVSPFMVYLDRFLIGAVISVAGVAYYATPYEVVTKLSLLAGALSGVLYPAFAASYAYDRARTRLLFLRGTKFIFLALLPIVFAIVLLARQGLEWWVGPVFASNSAPVMQLLAIGVLFNAVAQLPFTLVQGVGRPDLTAKLHLAEFPIYVVILWLAIGKWGIVGAAAAASLRLIMDCLLMFGLAGRFISFESLGRPIGIGAAYYGLIAVVLLGVHLAVVRVALCALAILAYLVITWFVLMSQDERSLLLAFGSKFSPAKRQAGLG